MELTATIGAMRFRLSWVEHAVFPSPEGDPFLLLSDGTEVRVITRGGKRYLCIDHRRDDSFAARIEFWECLDSPEADLTGMLAIGDCARPTHAAKCAPTTTTSAAG